MNPRLDLFPITTEVRQTPDGERLFIAGCDIVALAATFGTPLYVFDQATMDGAVASYRAALGQAYPGQSALTFAGKAFMCVALAQWTQQQDLWLDCTGAGELYVAKMAGVPRERTLVHGVNKTNEDLRAAVEQAGVIVVDNGSELRRLATILGRSVAQQSTQMASPGQPRQPEPAIWLRVRPGVAVDTHAYRQTGQEDSKFGMSLAEAVDAVLFCLQHDLQVEGVHFHQGSHFHDVTPIGPGLERVLDMVEELHGQTGWSPTVLSPGGGWGVPYHEDDLPHPSIETYVEFVAQQLARGCEERGLPLPVLHLEPGRSLVGRAGVAIYSVGAVKQSASRRWLLVDGGMADNPRPALYGARYSALAVAEPNRPAVGPAWIAGPYCETGDILIHDLPMPDMIAGELLAVPVSGAYHINMSSNYNGARKPAVLWLRNGEARLVLRRETVQDLVGRDVGLAT